MRSDNAVKARKENVDILAVSLWSSQAGTRNATMKRHVVLLLFCGSMKEMS